MEVRDAVETDAGRMAALADAPSDVMRNLVHDRTVRVAEADDGRDAEATGPDGPGGPDRTDPGNGTGGPDGTHDPSELLGFVSFDAREGTVHVTQVEGTREAVETLLAEPVRFARGEGMTVELLVSDAEETVRDAVEAVGFRSAGAGPRFDGQSTTRYRLEP